MNRGKPRSRRRPYREPANILYIFSEGAKTEVIYFTEISRRFRENLHYSLDIVPSPHTDPIGLVHDALDCQKKCTSDDEVWCFFDRDDNQDRHLKEAILLAQDKIHIVFSNPCFELWYDLHFRYTTAQYDQKEMKHRIKEFLPQYSESMPALNMLCDRTNSLQDAIRNAKRLNEYHSSVGNDINSRSGNPSTQVFQILERLDIEQY